MEDVTAEITAERTAPAAELRLIPRVTIGAKTDMGRVRENNEDKHEFFLNEDPGSLASRGHIFVVCDGMGGHEAGQFASEFSVKTFIDVYRSHPSPDPEAAARDAARAANRFVHDISVVVPARRGMGTTLSALCIVQDQAVIAHVGDSRVYRLQNGVLDQLTSDHTWVEMAVSQGLFSREAAEVHPQRHMLLRAVGVEQNVEVDTMVYPLLADDRFLLCSDGLTNHVGDEEIKAALADDSPSVAAWNLVAKAMQGGGSDNCTCLIVRIDALEPVGG